MNTKSIIAIALAALLVFAGGAAAMPGQSPDNPGADTAGDQQPDDPDVDDADAANESDDDGNVTDEDDADDAENESADADESEDEVENESEDVTDADDARDENATDAPPTDMPEPVPDHVSQIHQLIRDKLNGDLGNTTLGEAISGVVGSDDAADENAGEQSENASDNAEEQSSQADEHAANAGVAGDLPEQAADHVSAIHDAIQSFLNGDGNPGDEVSSAAG